MDSLLKPSEYRPPLIVYEGHEGAITSVTFSPDGGSIVSGSLDKTIRIWDSRSKYLIGPALRRHTNPVCSLSYSPLGDILVSGSEDHTIRLWNLKTGWQLGAPLSCSGPVLSVAFSPGGRLVASASRSSIRIWDVQTRALVCGPLKGHTKPVNSVQFSPDGTQVVSAARDKSIRVWNLSVGAGATLFTSRTFEGHNEWVSMAVFSPDGSQIASCSYDGSLRIWDTRNGKVIGNPYWGHTDMVVSASFSPDGMYIASGSCDCTVRLWDIRTSRQVNQPFREHDSLVRSVTFSPCGQYIASGSGDHKVVIRSILSQDSVPVEHEARMITRQMSTKQIFDRLIDAGCTDLSSQMDNRQETAMIVSGGGFGDIWIGKLYSGGKVAIKAWRTNIFEQCSDKTLKRAARELFYWSRMHHSNVHQLQGVIMFKGEYLGMVSEWMDNGNLHEYLRKYPGSDRYQLCVHIALGLTYMHSCSTVHGDLKAANVLVSPEGVAKLSDFDFSIMSEASSLVFSESSNTRPGSLRWAAPEILLADLPERTTQSDVYALGMTILEIFTGDVPYPEYRQDFRIIKAVEKGTLPTRPMEKLGDNQRDNLTWRLLMNCWSWSPDDRPTSERVVETLQQLAPYTDGA